jgi:hypothetical protein
MAQSPRLTVFGVKPGNIGAQQGLDLAPEPYTTGCLSISTATHPTAASNQSDDAFCEGQGGDREADGGHAAKRIVRLIHQALSYCPAPQRLTHRTLNRTRQKIRSMTSSAETDTTSQRERI